MKPNSEYREQLVVFEANTDLCVEKKYVQAEEDFKIHAHNYFELEVIMRGSGKECMNGKEYSLHRGYSYLLTPSDFHQFLKGSDLDLWNISFSSSLIPAELMSALSEGPDMFLRQLSEEELDTLDAAIHLLKRECENNGYVEPLMDYILKRILGALPSDPSPSPIRKAILYIEMHFHENPSLADAAAQACLSPVYFGNLFKQYTGKTYVKYLNERKVTCAKMLLDSGLSVTDACYNAGFGSLSGFLHSFKQVTGITPKEYKANCKRDLTKQDK